MKADPSTFTGCTYLHNFDQSCYLQAEVVEETYSVIFMQQYMFKYTMLFFTVHMLKAVSTTEYYQHVKMHNSSLNGDPNLKASTNSSKKLLDQEAHKSLRIYFFTMRSKERNALMWFNFILQSIYKTVYNLKRNVMSIFKNLTDRQLMTIKLWQSVVQLYQ